MWATGGHTKLRRSATKLNYNIHNKYAPRHVLPQEQTDSRHYVRSEAVVILDVGGEKFTALRQTLFRFPTSR